MPFFHQPAYLTPEATLFQFLSSLEDQEKSAAKPACAPRQQCKPAPTFTPRFDIAETSQSYEIWGELPGLEQKDISIEFTDAQTIVVKGQTSRVLETSAPTTTTETEAVPQQDTSSEKSFNPTVEDEYDAADTPLTTPASTTTVTEKEEATAPKQQEQSQAEKRKFWIAERKVGAFERTFNFSKTIDLEAVIAGLKNGLLHVVIPKSQKTRKVAVGSY